MERLINIPKQHLTVVDSDSFAYSCARDLLDITAMKNTRYLHEIYVGTINGVKYGIRRYRYSLMMDRYLSTYLS